MKKILFVALSMGAVAGTASASTRDLQRLAAQFGVDGSTCGLEKSTIPELCYFRCGEVFSAMCTVHEVLRVILTNEEEGTFTKCASASGANVSIKGNLCG